MAREQHGIEPVYDARSRILILGSFPSVKSRETQFFYGHPQNRFWRIPRTGSGVSWRLRRDRRRREVFRRKRNFSCRTGLPSGM